MHDFYEQRLEIVEAYDRGGFYSYHTAEHHATPLGLAASPSVFLAAVAQRTQNLRFGPLVYTLPLHHPLRVVEEICMLDQMSRGRFDLGVGRGISPIETAYYGVDPDHRQKMYLEALADPAAGADRQDAELCRRVLPTMPTCRWSSSRSRSRTRRSGPASARPTAARSPDATASAWSPMRSRRSVRAMTDRYRAAYRVAHRGYGGTPMLGLCRFVIMGETDEQALTIARRAYPLWHRHFHHLFRMHGKTPAMGDRPPHFDQIKDGGRGIAGSPATVARMIKSQMEEAGTDYFVAQFAFGDLTLSEVLRTVDLFVARGDAGVAGRTAAEFAPDFRLMHNPGPRKRKPMISAVRRLCPPLSVQRTMK